MNRINPFLLVLSISILLGGETAPEKDIQSQLNYSQEIPNSDQKGLTPQQGQKDQAERQKKMDSFRDEMEKKHAEMINQFPDLSPRLKQSFNQKTLQNNKSGSFDPKSFNLKMKSSSRSERRKAARHPKKIDSGPTVQSSSSFSKQLENKYSQPFHSVKPSSQIFPTVKQSNVPALKQDQPTVSGLPMPSQINEVHRNDNLSVKKYIPSGELFELQNGKGTRERMVRNPDYDWDAVNESRDDFGYEYMYDDDGFEWVELETADTLWLGDDDGEYVTLPGDFPFYDNSNDKVGISSNGWLHFPPTDDETIGLSEIWSEPLPAGNDSYVPAPVIAAYATDGYPNGVYGDIQTGVVTYGETDDSFVITWHNWSFCCTDETFYEMQAILYPDGDFVLQYQNVDLSDLDNDWYYNFFTIGMQNGDSDDGITVVHNDSTMNIYSGMRLKFDHPGEFEDGALVDCVCDAQYHSGDRVVSTVDNPSDNGEIFLGSAGTVVCGNSEYDVILVDWDDVTTGHNGNDYCECGDGPLPEYSGWGVYCNEIEMDDGEDGDPVYFEKEDWADVSDPDNWDHITESVAITRGDNQGLFNPYQQDGYDYEGPSGTLWAPMSTEEAMEALDTGNVYFSWGDAVDWCPPCVVDEDQILSLWIIEEDEYYDIDMVSWTIGEESSGGGFAYWRYPAGGQENNEDGSGTVHASVYDHEGNPNDSAFVVFFNGDSSVGLGVDENGYASAELPSGPWSIYAGDSDTTTYFDLWDGGVVHVEDGSDDFVELFLYPREEYGFVIAHVYTMINDSTQEYLDAFVIIEDNEGSIHFEGYTNVWGDIGDPLPPGDDYLVRVESEYGYQEQYISVDVNSNYWLSFEFQTDDEDDDGEGVEFYFSTVDSLYLAYGSVFSSMGADCDNCPGNLSEMTADDYVTIRTQETFESWASPYEFTDYFFQFIDANGNYEHDIGEVYAVSCENGTASGDWGGGNMTVAYDGNVYWLDFIDFWDQAYDFDWEGEDGEDDDFEFLGEFEGHWYYLSPMDATWHDAYMFTDTIDVGEGAQVYLGTITSPGENDFIRYSIDSLDAFNVWIGFTDEEEEGNWQWVTGEEVTYTNWADGEPNNGGGEEHYAEMWADGTWNDTYYGNYLPFVVELVFSDDSGAVYFEKEDYADFNDPDNWDHITESVAITRGDNQGLYNPYQDGGWNGNGPSGTLWAPMPTGQASTFDYVEWIEAVDWCPPCVVGQTISLWCLEENMYFDIEMVSWTESNNGGGFAYWRYPAEFYEGQWILVSALVGNDDTGDGSFENPYATIGQALEVMNNGDFILVAPGTYQENLYSNGQSGSILAFSGPDSTIIDGGGEGSCLVIENAPNSWLIGGFTFTNGYANEGGGIAARNSDGLILGGNRFIENTAEEVGGGVFALNTNTFVDSCQFISNSANTYDGGGLMVISNDSSGYRNVSINNSLFYQNSAVQGAGVYLYSSDESHLDAYMDNPLFVQNTGNHNVGLRVGGNVYCGVYGGIFAGNQAQAYAGAAGYSGSSSAWFDHSLFVGNQAGLNGGDYNSGAVSVWSDSYADFYFCTFTNNSASYGSAVTTGMGANAYIYGSIVWNNPGANSLAAVNWDGIGGYMNVNTSDIENGEDGVYADDMSYIDYYDNISSPPFFCDPESGDFSIDELSPAVTYWGEPMGAFGFGCSGTIQASASILSIEDVPNDQGGRVYITFEGSLFDTDGLGRTEMYTVERLDGDQWVGLNSIGAYASDVYVVEATTLADSTSDNDAVMTYRIIANMDEGNYESDPASGYSVDNIAPGLVAGLQANVSDGVVNLSWNVSEANDLSHYVVYRGNSPDFTADEGSMIGETTDPGFADDVTELGDYYYVVTAVDIHENESDPSDAVNVTLLSLVDVHGLPEEYALHQNYPNPFNPTTTLRYDLPEDATVSVVIYDMMGRQVRTLVSGQASAGYHSTMWNATNDLGYSVSAGVYIYTIQAGQYRDVKKMILLK